MSTMVTKKRVKDLRKARDLLTPHIWAASRGGHAIMHKRLLNARALIREVLAELATMNDPGYHHDGES